MTARFRTARRAVVRLRRAGLAQRHTSSPTGLRPAGEATIGFQNPIPGGIIVPTNIDPEQPVSWRVVPQDVAVRGSDGVALGSVHDLLGSNDEDIFHGIVIRLAVGGRNVFVPVDDVALMTGSHVDLKLTAEQVRSLPDHAEDRTFHLGWKGVFHKNANWVEDKDR
jgi:hypothetical protein